MPGIVGLITRAPRPQAEWELRSMLAVMRHESFYVSRTLVDGDLGLYVGWTSRRGSFSDAGPHVNEAGDVTLIFSGEDYPAPDDVAQLKRHGHDVGDDEGAHIVHVYEEKPELFPASLNGRFHGVLIDRRRRIVLLFNDRYAMHRLYVHASKGALYFAAEAKAILAVRPELRRIDARGLGESISLGCVLENRTLFEGIEMLPGGSRWVLESGAASRRGRYFEATEWENQTILEPEKFYQETRATFARILPRYFNGRDRIGVSLTGGLDSRMVMAWQRCQPGSLPSYTWGGIYRDCRDVVVAREVARVCGQPHHVIPMGGDLLTRFSHYADRAVYLTDGCVDIGLAPDVYMNQHAREIAPVRMTGLYGGEVLRRVRMFKPSIQMEALFAPELVPQFEAASATYRTALQGHALSFGVFKQAPWHHGNSLLLEETQVTMRSPFLDNEFVKLIFQAPPSATTTSEVSTRLIADGNPALARIPMDRAQGASTIGQLISHIYQEFTFKAEYAYDYGMPQWLAYAEHILAPLSLERLFLGRHKPLHFRRWYRAELADYVREMLLDPMSLARPYLDRKTLERIVNGHVKGTHNFTTEIHKLLKLELIHRNFIDGPVGAAKLTASSNG